MKFRFLVKCVAKAVIKTINWQTCKELMWSLQNLFQRDSSTLASWKSISFQKLKPNIWFVNRMGHHLTVLMLFVSLWITSFLEVRQDEVGGKSSILNDYGTFLKLAELLAKSNIKIDIGFASAFTWPYLFGFYLCFFFSNQQLQCKD